MSDTDIEALRKAQPSWLVTPNPKTPLASPDQQRIGPFDKGQAGFSNSHYQAPFPTPIGDAGAITEQTVDNNEYGFQLDLDSVDQEAYTVDIHVGYGLINGIPPDGMTEADDFIFTIPGAADGTLIYAVVTYDTSTLAITSRTLAFGMALPDSSFGTSYLFIGSVAISYTSKGAIGTITPRNAQCGDINLALIYGNMNGAPAVFLVSQLDDPQPIS